MASSNSKIESVEVILMSKESKFDEPYIESETYNFTTDYTKWLRFILSQDGEHSYVDKNVLMLASKCKGFMLGPVGKIGTIVLNLISKNVENIDEFSIDWTNCYIYQAQKVVNLERVSDDDPRGTYIDSYDAKTFKPMHAKVIETYSYKIRYAEAL